MQIPHGFPLSEAPEEDGWQPDELDDEADDEEDVKAEEYLEKNVCLTDNFVCVHTGEDSNQGHGAHHTETQADNGWQPGSPASSCNTTQEWRH